jgi:hypothetical protein
MMFYRKYAIRPRVPKEVAANRGKQNAMNGSYTWFNLGAKRIRRDG